MPNMVTSSACPALGFAVLVCCSVAYVFAEPLIYLLFELCVRERLLGLGFLAQLLAGLAVRLGAPLWHGSIIRRES